MCAIVERQDETQIGIVVVICRPNTVVASVESCFQNGVSHSKNVHTFDLIEVNLFGHFFLTFL